MTRLNQGAQVVKWTASLMAFSLIATPIAWAQSNIAGDTTNGTLNFKPPSLEMTSTAEVKPGQDTSASESVGLNKISAPNAAAIAASTEPVNSEAPSLKIDGDNVSLGADDASAKSAETTGGEAAVGSGTELADTTGGTANKRLDPAYKSLPTNGGEGKIRRDFKLFAKEELIHNLSFRETPIKEVIAELARRGNLNILIDRSVIGNITGDLHDVTLNEAMDAVLAQSGLQARTLDSNTVIVGSPNALTLMGLNRTHYKVFKLSYITPWDISNILFTSVFNRGVLPDFSGTFKQRYATAKSESPKSANETREETQSAGVGAGGANRRQDAHEQSSNAIESKEESDAGADYSFSSRLDNQRQLKGTSRTQIQEGTGFNNAGQDPGTEQIRAFQEITQDYIVDQNGGGAIVIPDNRNRQVVVVGTPDDLAVAEECIRCLDKRPKQIHVQVSLIELNNSGIRQLGASLNLQGQGASGALLGGTGAPLINSLPGFGSQGATVARTATGTLGASNGNQVQILPAGNPNPLTGTFTSTQTASNPAANTVTAPSTGYAGILGGFFPAALAANIAGITASSTAASNFNFLALNKEAGGRTNIATVPMGLNLSVNMLLQQNKAKILANPSVVVSDNTEALVTLAQEVIHKVTSTVSLGVTNVNVELTKAGIFLDVLPKASEDGFIYMRIRPQVSAPLGPPQTFANQQVIVTLLNIREIMAQEVRVKDGQTLVLGGLFSEQEAAQISKVPYLAETPLFGALFRNTLKGRDRRELMLMITPRIVEEQPGVPPISEANPGAKM